MGTQVRDLFNDNLLNADMYMGVIKATIFSCVFCLVIIISGKCKKDLCNGSLELIGKMAFEIVKFFTSIATCAFVYELYKQNKISIATLFVVVLAIIQIADSIISMIEIARKIAHSYKIKNDEEQLSDLKDEVDELRRLCDEMEINRKMNMIKLEKQQKKSYDVTVKIIK